MTSSPPRPAPAPAGPDGIPAGEWIEAAEWGPRLVRLGPLRLSDLGRRRLAPVTVAEVEPVAGWIATAADRWWAAGGRPDPFTLAVVSGDDGTLAAAVMASGAACLGALRYVVVHPDAPPGADDRPVPPVGLSAHIDLEQPAFLYPAARPGSEEFGEWDPDVDGGPPPARRVGPLATFLTEVPALGAGGAVVAVGLLSRLPYDLYRATPQGWSEVRVTAAPDAPAVLEEIEVPVAEVPAGLAAVAPGPTGRRVRLLTGAARWLRRTLAAAPEGVLAVVDDWSGADRPGALDAAQLGRIRAPLRPGPEPIAGSAMAAVTWRLG